MSFQTPSLTFTSLFGDGLKAVENQNHIFPESGIVTCSIIESSRGSLICVPVTDGFSSDCDSYLTVVETGVQKCTNIESKSESVAVSQESPAVDCMQEQHDEDKESRLFVHTQDDTGEDVSEVLFLATRDSPSPNSDSIVIQEDNPPAATSADPEKKVGKKKGGWPKGKKRRKGSSVTTVPKAPATGYVLFLNKRRKQMKKSHPEIPFSEVTKKIGNEWTNLPLQEKQVYLKTAEEEKKRYREELKQYQQSEAYQTCSAKKKTMHLDVTLEKKNGDKTVTVPIHDIEDEDFRQLYCAICDQLFSSVHNKKEHLYGKQHLSNITGAIHQVTSSGDKKKGQHDTEDDITTNCESQRLRDSVTSVFDAMDLLVTLSRDRLSEIEFLTQSNVNLRQHKLALEKDLKLLEELFKKREEELEAARVEGKTLNSQLVDLRMVPKLFGIINF